MEYGAQAAALVWPYAPCLAAVELGGMGKKQNTYRRAEACIRHQRHSDLSRPCHASWCWLCCGLRPRGCLEALQGYMR
jgi:hypothetical protein